MNVPGEFMSKPNSTPEDVRGQTSGVRGQARRWAVAAAVALVVGCGTDVVTSTPRLVAYGKGDNAPGRLVACERRDVAVDSALIGPAGGTLRVGANELVVPPGALTVTVMLRGEVPEDTVASIRLFPEGLIFRKPAGLVLDTEGCADPGSGAKILYLDEAGNVLEEIDAHYRPWWKRVAAPINHFSRYALGV
jgi:hypothetical protein